MDQPNSFSCNVMIIKQICPGLNVGLDVMSRIRRNDRWLIFKESSTLF